MFTEVAPLITGPALDSALDEVRAWRRSLAGAQYARIRRIPLDAIDGWETGAGQAAFRHHTSRFFSVVGIEARSPGGAAWTQPMIDQPEIGLLGIAITRSERGHAALIQAKAEPGNVNGIQLSPTVQATRSNAQRAHGGRAVPYLDLFAHPDTALVDTRQSEHGAVFWRKRNRVMVVEVPPLDPRPGFRWVELADLLGLLRDDDLVHADTRAVLACLPWGVPPGYDDDGERAELRRSLRPAATDEPLRGQAPWMSAQRSSGAQIVRPVPLPQLRGWQRSAGAVRRGDGGGFEVVAVEVSAQGREVDRWAQPMVRPRHVGLTGLALATVDDEARVLLRMCAEPGLVDGAELGPTVQCAAAGAPPDPVERDLRARLTAAPPEDTVFDSVLSDEGGRFLHGRQRHLVVRVDPFTAPPGYRWCRLAELTGLLIHSHQVNMQARSILLCLLSTLWGADDA